MSLPLWGKPVVVYPVLPVVDSVRPLHSKRWHARGCYARRVGKKWDKRYGVRTVEILDLGHCFLVSAGVYRTLFDGGDGVRL